MEGGESGHLGRLKPLVRSYVAGNQGIENETGNY